MKLRKFSQFSALFLGILFVAVSYLPAQDSPSAADYLPDSTAIYMHVEKPADFIGKIEGHPIVDYVLEMKQVQQLLKSPQGALVMLGRGMFEAQIDENIIEALKSNTANGFWIGVEADTNGVLIAFQAKEEARLKRVAGQALKMVTSMAKRDGKKQPFKKVDYRDAVAADFGKFIVVRHRDWFLICNKSKLAKEFVDNQIDGTKSALSSQTWFKEAKKNRDPNADAWAAVNMEILRKSARDPSLRNGQTDNPGVELFVGGVLDALKNSPTVLANLDLEKDLHLSFTSPFQSDWANESRDYFFGNDLNGLAPKALQPKNLIASLTSYRDIGQWWLAKEELYPENVIAELAQADSQLSTIFSGMDFGEDVLGSLKPGVQIVVTENQFDKDYVPDVQLPSFALVGKIKDKKSLERKLKIAFQSLIGFANINLGMNGQPQLEVDTEKTGDTRITAANYFFEDSTEEGLLLFNFSPTVAFKGDNIVLSSSRELAVELAELAGKGGEESVNTKLEISGKMLHSILSDNSESLIAQNMLEEGNDRDEAEQQIKMILTVAQLMKDFGLKYDVQPDQMSLEMKLRFSETGTNSETEK